MDKEKRRPQNQIDKARGYQSSQAYVNVGHGRKVIAGKLKKNPGLYSGPAEIAVGAAGLGAFGGAGIVLEHSWGQWHFP